MRKYFDTILAADGKPVAGASVTVAQFGSISPTAIFSNSSGTVPIDNPLTTDANGFFEFYAADGRYTLIISANGFGTRTVTDIALDDPADASQVTVNGGSVNNTPIGATTPSTGAFTTLSYTGTLTGGTGVVNFGSGQFYKDASGNIGIGTSSPGFKLDINGTASVGGDLDVGGAVFRKQAAGTGYLAYGTNGATNNGVYYDQTNSAISLWTVSVPRLIIDSSGNTIQQVNTTAATLTTNSTLTFSIVDNSTLRISVRGSDGVTRNATVALA